MIYLSIWFLCVIFMMMKSVESIRLLVNLADVLGHSQRSGLPLPWIKHRSVSSSPSWICCSIISAAFYCLSLTVLRRLLRVQLYFWWRPSITYGSSLLFLFLQLFPVLYISLRIAVFSSCVRNIALSAFLSWLSCYIIVAISNVICLSNLS